MSGAGDRDELRWHLVQELSHPAGSVPGMPSRPADSVWPAHVARVEVGPGLAYWTVLSGLTLEPVRPVDHYPRHLRVGPGRAESTRPTPGTSSGWSSGAAPAT